ncbi:GNAT family N-acetyltransferase [Bacillus massiliglaciei]|uniref:GNAT family N-acetyltransferase n=1 Tax=Bacillus massiliglaciei TaxID=1816693 RepID=UPI000A3DFC77|nr:GNAT family N-acetyltransferase [Bacillus massiliglaciei]
MLVTIAATPEERTQAYSIRKKVFVEEQRVPLEEEIDQYEDEATHFLLLDDQGSPSGAGRFRILDGIGKVERICVLADKREKGAGAAIMGKIEEFAKQHPVSQLKLNAQVTAIPFYEKLGYHIVSKEFMDAGIPHKTMVKNL